MKYAFKEMTFDEWEKTFKPMPNHIAKNAAFDGFMFETYDAELAHVLLYANGYFGKASNRKVWTLVEGDDGESVIVDGYQLCNRIGYFITQEKAKANVQYNVI